MPGAMGGNAPDDAGVHLAAFEFFDNDAAVLVGVFFPVGIMEEACEPPFMCLFFRKLFFFQGPGFLV